MNKAELISAIADQTGQTKVDFTQTLTAIKLSQIVGAVPSRRLNTWKSSLNPNRCEGAARLSKFANYGSIFMSRFMD